MHIICDDRDRTHWLEERRKRITASDLGTFMGLAPDYFTSSKQDILDEKSSGVDRVFGGGNSSNVAHGRHDETNNLQKASLLFGLPVCPFHYLVGDERWPYLAATLDGLGLCDFMVPPDTSYAKSGSKYGRYDTLGQVLETISELEALQGVCVVELKQTGSHIFKRKDEKRSWIEELPEYLIPQVQCQMWITGIAQCLIVGQLGADNMTGYLVFRDDTWKRRLDEANEEAMRCLGQNPKGGGTEIGF